jgi:hypothetical protein
LTQARDVEGSSILGFDHFWWDQQLARARSNWGTSTYDKALPVWCSSFSETHTHFWFLPDHKGTVKWHGFLDWQTNLIFFHWLTLSFASQHAFPQVCTPCIIFHLRLYLGVSLYSFLHLIHWVWSWGKHLLLIIHFNSLYLTQTARAFESFYVGCTACTWEFMLAPSR